MHSLPLLFLYNNALRTALQSYGCCRFQGKVASAPHNNWKPPSDNMWNTTTLSQSRSDGQDRQMTSLTVFKSIVNELTTHHIRRFSYE